MSIQDLGALGELVGSIAVVISLIYVALQLRENTRSMQAVEANEVAQSLQQFSENILRDPVSRRLYREYILAEVRYEDVSEEDRFDLHLLLQAAFMNLWRSFKASKLGYSDEELWYVNINLIRRTYFPSTVVKGWWDERGNVPFPDNYREMVDSEFEKAG